MMNIIKRFFLIFICFILVFSCCPVLTYAEVFDYDGTSFNLSTDFSNPNYGQLDSKSAFDSQEIHKVLPDGFVIPNNDPDFRYCVILYKKPISIYTEVYFIFMTNRNFSPSTSHSYNGKTFYSAYFKNLNGKATLYGPLSYVDSTFNCPLFYTDVNNYSAAYRYLDTGDYSGSIQSIGTPSVSPSELGFIKPSYYVNNALLTGPMTVSDSPETITWQNVSTTGYDLNQNGVQIRFMIKDRSVYQRNENAWGTGTLGTINNFITNVTGFLSSNLFPNGSWQKSWLRGDVTRSDTHEQFFGQKFSYPGSRGKASFNWLASYRDHPQIQISTYANDMLSTNKSFYESLYQNTLGDFTIPYISWDIYAQIIAPDGTEGNWLKIDKHAAPFQEQGNRLDGGVTDEPVQITPSIPDNNTWNDGDETPLEDDDDDDPLPVGYVDPGSGDTYNEYNNYTYNYDNRSWIENHYDNSTVESVNDGIDWIKLFPGFFGLFLKFFGAFLPSWAVACVTIGIPIILGLILFRLIKGVIPFL